METRAARRSRCVAGLSPRRCARADVVVDLAELAFADASLMLDLVMVAGRLRKAGRRLILHRPQPHIRRLIELVGLHRLPGVAVMPAPA